MVGGPFQIRVESSLGLFSSLLCFALGWLCKAFSSACTSLSKPPQCSRHRKQVALIGRQARDPACRPDGIASSSSPTPMATETSSRVTGTSWKRPHRLMSYTSTARKSALRVVTSSGKRRRPGRRAKSIPLRASSEYIGLRLRATWHMPAIGRKGGQIGGKRLTTRSKEQFGTISLNSFPDSLHPWS